MDCCGEAVGNGACTLSFKEKASRTEEVMERRPFPPASQDHPLIAYSLRHPLPIQIFQQRNRILPADAGEVFEARHIQPRGEEFLRGQAFAKLGERGLME